MRVFDEKFGPDFLGQVPAAPGVYRLYDGTGSLLYVGKAKNLRRRLAQYRLAGRKRRDRKPRRLVKAAVKITWELCESDLDAALEEIRLIQTLRPARNVASASPFLYPFVGVHAAGDETYFCLTTSPAAFPAFDFHGAFRSREVTGEAFFSLMRLLKYPGHPVPRHRCQRLGAAKYSHVLGFRRLPAALTEKWDSLLRGGSRDALEWLALDLLEHAGARAKRTAVQEDLEAIERFFVTEAEALARARTSARYTRYPVPQEDRDLLFVRLRQAAR